MNEETHQGYKINWLKSTKNTNKSRQKRFKKKLKKLQIPTKISIKCNVMIYIQIDTKSTVLEQRWVMDTADPYIITNEEWLFRCTRLISYNNPIIFGENIRVSQRRWKPNYSRLQPYVYVKKSGMIFLRMWTIYYSWRFNSF